MSKHKYSKEFIERTGLKLDDINPGKKEEVKTEVPVNAELTEKAVGLARIKDGGGYKYSLVEIEYNLETKQAGSVKTLFTTGSKEEAVNNFKFLVDDINLFYYER